MKGLRLAILAATLLFFGCNRSTEPVVTNAPDKDARSNTAHPEAQPSSDDDRPAEKRDLKAELDSIQRRDKHIFQQVRNSRKE